MSAHKRFCANCRKPGGQLTANWWFPPLKLGQRRPVRVDPPCCFNPVGCGCLSAEQGDRLILGAGFECRDSVTGLHLDPCRCPDLPPLMPGGESISAQLDRVRQELAETRETLAVYRQELAAALPALKRTAAERDEARAAVSNALRCFDELQTAAGRKYQELGDERDRALSAFNVAEELRLKAVAELKRLREHQEIRARVIREKNAKLREVEHLLGIDAIYPPRDVADAVRELLAGLEQLRAVRSWLVARDGGRDCLFCGTEIRRGEAYELVPDQGLDALKHIHCPTSKETPMTPQEHYRRGLELLAAAEARADDEPGTAQTLATLAHSYFTAATAGSAMQMFEIAMHPERVVTGEPEATEALDRGAR